MLMAYENDESIEAHAAGVRADKEAARKIVCQFSGMNFEHIRSVLREVNAIIDDAQCEAAAKAQFQPSSTSC